MSKEKVKKHRGSRTCGGGTHKNRRGAGNRGGRGNAGVYKHHVMRTSKRGVKQGKDGFTRHAATRMKKIVNVGELDEIIEALASDGIARREDDSYHLDLADLEIDKVLGRGRVTKRMIIHAEEATPQAKSKIESVGGSVTVRAK
ncbi:50S ribosomal protein L15 [Methanosarcinales archaeon]|nr:MAG: 50S ribosomal protein L15 [Methanosarcinales archaeon]